MRGTYTIGYDPPATERSRPAVITWFRVYAATTAMLYVGVLLFWLSLGGPDEGPYGEHLITIALTGVVLTFGTAFAVGAFVPYKPWGWTLGLVLICLGLSGCMMPFTIPLLVYWWKPETKAAFCRI